AHGLDAETELTRNVAWARSRGHETKHDELAVGELLVRRTLVVRADGARELRCHSSAQVLFAAPNRADRADELLRRAFLVEVPTGSRAKHAHRVLLFWIHRQNQHGHLRPQALELLQQLETGLARHRYIDERAVPV